MTRLSFARETLRVNPLKSMAGIGHFFDAAEKDRPPSGVSHDW